MKETPLKFVTFGILVPLALVLLFRPCDFAPKKNMNTGVQKTDKTEAPETVKDSKEIIFADNEAKIMECLDSEDMWKLRYAVITIKTKISQDKRFEKYAELVINREIEVAKSAKDMKMVASDWEMLNPGKMLPENIVSLWDGFARAELEKASTFKEAAMLWYDCRLGSEIQKETGKKRDEILKKEPRRLIPRRLLY